MDVGLEASTPSVAVLERGRSGIRYMGNKDALAPAIISSLQGESPRAPFVDLFGGMCSVAGAAAGTNRQAWTNDIQQFATLAAGCLLTARREPPSRHRAEQVLAPWYRENLAMLQARFGPGVEAEKSALHEDEPCRYRERASTWRHVGNDDALATEAAALRRAPYELPYRQNTITFAWGYFGVRQAMQLDSLRYAIDRALEERRFTSPEARWCRLALLGAASRISTSPGHFAQYLRGDTTTALARIRRQRQRSAWDWSLAGLSTLRPYGSAEWRRGNRVFHQDADSTRLWGLLDAAVDGSAVVYADPPYSKDHYSRYYHVLESLDRYDYPESEGVGRYRTDRFRTPFSVRSEVLDAVTRLCERVSERGWTLALSYPSSGLLTARLGIDLMALLREHFSRVRVAFEAGIEHSTLGARHGDSTKNVNEFLWIAN